MVLGLSIAIAVSYVICQPLHSHTLSLAARVVTTAAYILIACMAGSVGTWIALPGHARRQFRSLALWGIRCWVFLPSIMIFLREKAPWAPIIAFISAVLMALYLSRIPNATTHHSHPDVEKSIFITQLHLQPISAATIATSVCLYGAVVSVITARISMLTLSLAIGSFLLLSQIIAIRSTANRRLSQKSRSYQLLASAFLCVFVALTVPGQRLHIHLDPPSASSLLSSRHASQRNSSAGYKTIVLWPV